MERIMKDLKRLADLNKRVPILLIGETGTGKDVVARLAHNMLRNDKPFKAINCAAIPENLLESELFGAKKGAYTGLDRDKKGKFEQANGGTLFLDEISSMPVNLQAKLLRAIETLKIEPLGCEDEGREVDVLIIAAANRNIKQLIREKKFRNDLYFRLTSAEFYLPPLRERPEDIRMIAENFLVRMAKLGYRRRVISDGELKELEQYCWPGNARQLTKFLERLLIFEETDRKFEEIFAEIRRDDEFMLEECVVPAHAARAPGKPMSLDEAEKEAITAALEYADYNKSRARKILGIEHHDTLKKKMEKYGIREREGK